MEQRYWASIHDNLADGIQFFKNHGGVTESTEGSPQRPAKKMRRFSRVLDTQIRILVPHSPTSLARPSHPPPSPPTAVDDSPSHPRPPPPPPPPAAVVDDSPSPLPPTLAAAVDDSQFESGEFQMSHPSHPTPAAPRSHLPSPQAILPIQVILTTST